MSETTQPSDIVERLESALSHFVATEAEGMTSYTSEMLREAAAEITRLRAALAAERETQVMDNLHEQDLRYSWMQNPNERGIAYFNGVLHTSGVELSNEVRAMLLEEFAAVEARALAAERERCARVAENIHWSAPTTNGEWALREAAKSIAAAIRAGGS